MAENSMTVVDNRFSDRFGQGAWFALPRGRCLECPQLRALGLFGYCLHPHEKKTRRYSTHFN